MPADGSISREEFDRHDNDEDAHGKLVRRLQTDSLNVRAAFDLRVSALERWQQRIIGAFALLTFLVAAGLFGLVVEFLRHV